MERLKDLYHRSTTETRYDYYSLLWFCICFSHTYTTLTRSLPLENTGVSKTERLPEHITRADLAPLPSQILHSTPQLPKRIRNLNVIMHQVMFVIRLSLSSIHALAYAQVLIMHMHSPSMCARSHAHTHAPVVSRIYRSLIVWIWVTTNYARGRDTLVLVAIGMLLKMRSGFLPQSSFTVSTNVLLWEICFVCCIYLCSF